MNCKGDKHIYNCFKSNYYKVLKQYCALGAWKKWLY